MITFIIVLLRWSIFDGKIMDQNEGKEKSSQMPLRFDPQLLETLMGGIKYNHAYTCYKMEKIKGLKEIPREDLTYFPILHFTNESKSMSKFY
jgi:hypothetical protein